MSDSVSEFRGVAADRAVVRALAGFMTLDGTFGMPRAGPEPGDTGMGFENGGWPTLLCDHCGTTLPLPDLK